MRTGTTRWRFVWMVSSLAVIGAISVAVAPNPHRQDQGQPGRFTAINARHDAAREARQAKFESGHGNEAGREGATSPAAEAVADRAYPRSYVDDRLARREAAAYRQTPLSPSRSTFANESDYLAALAGRGAWKALGPVTPRVAGPDSQFFDPATLTGPPTLESGRVTALAIDPTCVPGSCRLWVAAAGGGIWRARDALAAQVAWIAPPDSLPTNSFGSLLYVPATHTLYAGSGEPNGSGDSEAGLGLFRSTDFGATWDVVPGSAAVATNRSIGAIAVDPNDPNAIYIGTDVARHGSSAVNGGRRTPPDAPAVGVYRSIDGGKFRFEPNLASKTPANPVPASTGNDWFQGGINKLEFDPNSPNMLYAAVQGYGIWRADQSVAHPGWRQVFHTMNQTDFTILTGDFFGDRTEFDMVDLGGGLTRMYVGDASDDWAIDGDATTPLPEAWRHDDVGSIVGSSHGMLDNSAAGWIQLSSSDPSKTGFAAYGYCQNGQCGYDSFVAHPAGASPGTVWYGGSMNYDELPAYDQFGTGAPPRSNGRAVIRSTNADSGNATTAGGTVTFRDMTAVLKDRSKPWGVRSGIHPDLHAIVFANNGDTAFIGSDGGVVRIDVNTTRDQSASCGQRTYNYDSQHPKAPPTPLQPDDLALCQELLHGVPASVKPLNDGLNTIQFQSLSFDPKNPTGTLQGGTQDNGTWSLDASRPPAKQWLESVGGDGGQSGFDAGHTSIRYHNYYDATPEVNFHGQDPATWLNIYDRLQITSEARSFYVPFTADPNVPGRAFIGLQHVWRTTDSGGSEHSLIHNGCLAYDLNPFRRSPCGDWKRIGQDLTGTSFGKSRAGQYVVASVRAPSDSGTLWAATRIGRVFVTSNAGAATGKVAFHRIDRPWTPERFVSGIAIDPKDPNHAWISYSGYNAYTPSTPGHVFDVRYNPTTHRAAFTDLSRNIADQPVTGIAQDAATGDLYAATDFGVLRLPHGSTQWIKAGGGLPTATVYGLTFSEQGRVLYAATHGRGAYALHLH